VFEVKSELLDTHEMLLDVEIAESAYEEAMQKAARSISGQVNIPGFRKGKAPYAMVLKTVGEAAVQQEAAEQLINELYPQIMDKAEVKPYASGQLENIQFSPLRYKIRVPLEPTVRLGDYTQLRREWVDPAVSEDEVERIIEQMRQQNAVLNPVERPVELGDEVHIDVTGVAAGDTIVDEKDIPVQMSEEAPFLSLEFVQALVGATAGEERAFTLPLPDTISEAELRGVETEFTVKVQHIFERHLPDVDDALASTVGHFETLEALKADIRERIMERKLEQQQEAYRAALVGTLVEQSEVTYPPVAVEETVENMIKDLEAQAQRTQKMSLEDSLRLEGRTLEALHEELHPRAEARLKRSLVMSQFAEMEKIEVSDDDVVREYANAIEATGLTGRMPTTPPSLDSPLARDLRLTVLGRKTLERLEAFGRGLVVPPADEESASGAE